MRRRLCPGPDWLPRGDGFRGGVSGVNHGSARQGDRDAEAQDPGKGGEVAGGLRVEEGNNLQGL